MCLGFLSRHNDPAVLPGSELGPEEKVSDLPLNDPLQSRRRVRRGGGRATITDVARLSNVAPITVSRALRAPGTVSAELRARIDAAVIQLGYEPDPAARALASSRSNMIGVLVPSLTNIVFNDVLRGIYDGTSDGTLQVQIGNTHYSTLEEERLLRSVISQRPIALIVSGIDQNPASRKILASAGCPVVQIMEVSEDPIDMLVGFSHFEGGRAATTHLLSVGYRRIGFVGARMDPRSQRRLAGYRRALEEAGLYDPDLVTTTMEPSSVPLGRRLIQDSFRKTPNLDAIFCNNDDLALGVLFECQHAGLNVPQRLGICGFNDLDLMAAACPPLTSVVTPRYEIGAQAMQMIRSRLNNAPITDPARDLGFSLCARESTKRR